MRLKGKKVLVYGLGNSGQAVCKVLHSEGACISIYDDDKRFSSLFCYEKEPLEKRYDLVVVSPGIKVIGNELISQFDPKIVMSELDFAFSFVKGKTIAVTGTNGKTTTCSLLGKIFSEGGKENFVCGNIGLPLSSVAQKTTKKTVTIIEVSNFQLELSKAFKPTVGAILNITDDHLDRHGCFEEYKRTKEKIFQNFSSQEVAVVNLDDEEGVKLNLPKKKKFFSKSPLEKGTYVKNGYVFCDKKKIMRVSQIPLVGGKNLENVLCAIAIARLFKIKPKTIEKAITKFVPPPHRLEFVGNVNGAKIYNDSKSTNVACSLMAISAVGNNGLILMLGGRNKDNDFEKLFSQNFSAKRIIAFGEAGQEVVVTANKYGYETNSFETMKEAALFAREICQSGDVVLFSPACASFDEFSSYAARGQRFKEIIMGQE